MLDPRRIPASSRLAASACLISLLIAVLGVFAAQAAPTKRFELLGRQTTDRSSPPADPTPSSTPSLLDCSSALPLHLGDTLQGDTRGLPSQVDLYGCAPYPETGGEIVYRLELTDPARFEISIESAVDMDVILLADCDPLSRCLALGDTGLRSIGPESGSFFVVVDGYAGSAGAFTLRAVERFETPVPEEACASAQRLEPLQMPYQASDISTCGGPEYLNDMLCSYSSPLGAERWYRLYLAAGATIEVEMRMKDGGDAAIWLLDGCGDGGSCLAFADQYSGSVIETLSWTNANPQPRFVYVVTDTYGGAGACTIFDIHILAELAVATASQSWSTLKAGFGPGGATP